MLCIKKLHTAQANALQTEHITMKTKYLISFMGLAPHHPLPINTLRHRPTPFPLLLPLLQLLLILGTAPQSCSAHALLCTPRQRAAYNEAVFCPGPVKVNTRGANITDDFCGHCLSGGGASVVRQYLPDLGWFAYDPTRDITTARRAGLCGDARSRTDHLLGGTFMQYTHVPIAAVWKAGAEVDFTVGLAGNHHGFFEFHLCNLDKCNSSDISESCFERSHCHRLDRATTWKCRRPRHTEQDKSSAKCGPIDINYRGRWHLPCTKEKEARDGVHFLGGGKGTKGVATMRYKLPEGVTCKHCVLQWYWVTAHTCNPHGFVDYFERNGNPFGTTCRTSSSVTSGARGGYSKTLGDCYGRHRTPEEFWSCTDVQISKTGKSLGPVPLRPAQEVVDELRGGRPADGGSGGGTGDGDKARRNPDKTKRDAVAQFKQDVKQNRAGRNGVDVDGGLRLRNGTCTREDEACEGEANGGKPCCNVFHVCVYTRKAGTFTCRLWWDLYQEMEERERELERQREEEEAEL